MGQQSFPIACGRAPQRQKPHPGRGAKHIKGHTKPGKTRRTGRKNKPARQCQQACTQGTDTSGFSRSGCTYENRAKYRYY